MLWETILVNSLMNPAPGLSGFRKMLTISIRMTRGDGIPNSSAKSHPWFQHKAWWDWVTVSQQQKSPPVQTVCSQDVHNLQPLFYVIEVFPLARVQQRCLKWKGNRVISLHNSHAIPLTLVFQSAAASVALPKAPCWGQALEKPTSSCTSCHIRNLGLQLGLLVSCKASERKTVNCPL